MIEVLERMRINESIKIEINYDIAKWTAFDWTLSGCDSGILQRKSAMQLQNILIKRVLLMRRFLRILKRGSWENLIERIRMLSCLI